MRSRAVSLPARCCFSMRWRAAAFAQFGFERVEGVDEVAHVGHARLIGGGVGRRFGHPLIV